jgi:hypothetical protein
MDSDDPNGQRLQSDPVVVFVTDLETPDEK